MTRALDGAGERSLVLGAGAALSACFDTTALRDEPAKEADIFVVDNSDLVGAHDADATSAANATPFWPFLIGVPCAGAGGRCWAGTAKRRGIFGRYLFVCGFAFVHL